MPNTSRSYGENSPFGACISNRGIRIPEIEAKARALIATFQNNQFYVDRALRLLNEARFQYQDLVEWSSVDARWEPFTRYPLVGSNTSQISGLFPKEIHIHTNVTSAAHYNHFRVLRLHLMDVILKLLRLLAAETVIGDCLPYKIEAEKMEKDIEYCVDDICATVPYHMNPANTRSIVSYYPHEPGAAPIPIDPSPASMVGICTMHPAISNVSSMDCVPRLQRLWLQQYLTTFSNDPQELR